ncbi:MAG: hypothetical protein V1862_03980 [Methanobacteriota archaeon]
MIRETSIADAKIISRYNTLMALETGGQYLDPHTVTKGVMTHLNNFDRAT